MAHMFGQLFLFQLYGLNDDSFTKFKVFDYNKNNKLLRQIRETKEVFINVWFQLAMGRAFQKNKRYLTEESKASNLGN